MAIKDLLYRCPGCGHDPMGGKGEVASCPRCGLEAHRGSSLPLALVVRKDGRQFDVPLASVTRRLHALGGPWPRAMAASGTLSYETRVRLRLGGNERPVRYRGRLLGFAERFGRGTPGTLLLTGASLTFRAGPGDAGQGRGEDRIWPLESLRSLQTSSSSLQITTQAGGLLLFRFDGDSPRRWDELLRGALDARWRKLGKGGILEFQPRILAGAP